jgi:hypothetical protein
MCEVHRPLSAYGLLPHGRHQSVCNPCYASHGVRVDLPLRMTDAEQRRTWRLPSTYRRIVRPVIWCLEHLPTQRMWYGITSRLCTTFENVRSRLADGSTGYDDLDLLAKDGGLSVFRFRVVSGHRTVDEARGVLGSLAGVPSAGAFRDYLKRIYLNGFDSEDFEDTGRDVLGYQHNEDGLQASPPRRSRVVGQNRGVTL